MKVLLFDVDGTLIRARGAGRTALNRAIYNTYGVRRDCGVLNLAGKTDLRNFKEAIEAVFPRRDRGSGPIRRATRSDIDKVHEEYLRLLPRSVKVCVRGRKYRLTRGIRALIKRLDSIDGVLLGLGTGNMEQGARIKLEPSGLNKYFSFGGFGSDAFRRSTLLRKAVARARKLISGARIRSRDVFVIGDTPLDVAAGKAAGYRTVGVGTGFAEWEDLVRSRPDFLAKDFTNTSVWLKWFGL